VIPELLPDGIYAVGSMKSPLDVMKSNEDATGAALKSLISLSRR
jgi:heterodisulfide reductase subunit A-like polyferredoxin